MNTDLVVFPRSWSRIKHITYQYRRITNVFSFLNSFCNSDNKTLSSTRVLISLECNRSSAAYNGASLMFIRRMVLKIELFLLISLINLVLKFEVHENR